MYRTQTPGSTRPNPQGGIEARGVGSQGNQSCARTDEETRCCSAPLVSITANFARSGIPGHGYTRTVHTVRTVYSFDRCRTGVSQVHERSRPSFGSQSPTDKRHGEGVLKINLKRTLKASLKRTRFHVYRLATCADLAVMPLHYYTSEPDAPFWTPAPISGPRPPV